MSPEPLRRALPGPCSSRSPVGRRNPVRTPLRLFRSSKIRMRRQQHPFGVVLRSSTNTRDLKMNRSRFRPQKRTPYLRWPDTCPFRIATGVLFRWQITKRGDYLSDLSIKGRKAAIPQSSFPFLTPTGGWFRCVHLRPVYLFPTDETNARSAL
jgi:hypothetical protein